MSTFLSIKQILDTWLSFIDGNLILQRTVRMLTQFAATSDAEVPAFAFAFAFALEVSNTPYHHRDHVHV
jgi:hypothetical protein